MFVFLLVNFHFFLFFFASVYFFTFIQQNFWIWEDAHHMLEKHFFFQQQAVFRLIFVSMVPCPKFYLHIWRCIKTEWGQGVLLDFICCKVMNRLCPLIKIYFCSSSDEQRWHISLSGSQMLVWLSCINDNVCTL